MAINEVINSAISKVRGVANKLYNTTQDNRGFIQQGRITAQPIQSAMQNIGQTKLPSGITLKQLPNAYMQSFNQANNPFAKAMNIGTANFIKGTTFGLVQPQAPKASNALERTIGLAGGVSGFLNPASPAMKGMGALEKVGQAGINKFAPQLTKSLVGKAIGGVGKELLQTAGYTAAQAGTQSLGLKPKEDINLKTFGSNLAFGTAFRGIGGASELLGKPKIKVKGMSPDVYISDKNIINEAMQRLKLGDTIEQNTKLLKDIDNMAGNYGVKDASWNKLNLEGKVMRLNDQLNQMASQGDNISMGIVGKSKETPFVEPKKVEVHIEINNKKMSSIGDVEKIVYGTPTGKLMTTEQVAKLNPLQRLELKASQLTSRGLESDSNIVRNISRLSQGFLGDLGKSRDIQMSTGQFRGGIDYANQLAGDFQQYAYQKANKESLSKIHSILDPELALKKVKESELTPDEKDLLSVFKTTSDFINDTNYKNGFISKETWEKGKGGKYIARAYENYDFPSEISDFVRKSKQKLDLDPFKQRKDITDWSKENAIRDPAYLMSKRLQQTMFNDEVSRMFNYLKDSPYVSNEAKAGFTQLSDHKAYGDLAGKYIRKDILDDIQGLHFSNDIAQKAYDVLGAFDRNPLRQGYKKIFTVFNPAVRLGNKTSNVVFSMLNGLNPVTFVNNQGWAKQQINSKSPIYRQLIQSGTLGTDFTKADIADIAQKMSVDGRVESGKIKALLDEFTSGYGRVDDIAKLAAFKTWTDKGVDPQQALFNVMRGYQNYRITGWLYDVASKLPAYGSPFARFSGELLRLTKNWAIDHPVALASTLMGWKLMSDAASRFSGETSEDRQTRESRVGAPRIPFTDISLELQTPWGTMNASRLIGLAAYNPVGGATMLDDTGRLSPVDLSQKGMISDPVLGPILAILRDKDFRGKSIKDPEMSKYIGSLLSVDEQRMNQIKYAVRQYSPTFANDLNDLLASVQGKEDFYGREKTPTQGVLKLVGIKSEQYGPEQAQAQRERDLSFQEYKQDSIQKQINAIDKQLLQGKITPEQAQKRIEDKQGSMVKKETGLFKTKAKEVSASEPSIKLNSTGEYSYLDEGVRRTVDLGSVINLPDSSNYDKLVKQKEAFKVLTKLEGNVPPMELNEIYKKLNISSDDVKYYKIANQTEDLKMAYLQDQFQKIASTGGTHNDLIEYLKAGTHKVNDKAIVSTGVLTDLYNQGLITYQEKKDMSNMLAGFKKSSSGKKAKVKKVKMPKLKSIKFKSPKKVKMKGVKLSKVKPIKFKKFKVAKYKKPKL